LYQQELQTTADRIREYERTTYYADTWEPEYERWVQMLAGLYRGPGRELVAWNAALLSDMIYTQPVLYEFGELRMPVLLVIGDKDTIRRPSAKMRRLPRYARRSAIIRSSERKPRVASRTCAWSNSLIWDTHRKFKRPRFSTRCCSTG
jgi:hypothetical protein